MRGTAPDLVASIITQLSHGGFYGHGAFETKLCTAHDKAVEFAAKKYWVPPFDKNTFGLDKRMDDFPAMAGKAALIKQLIFFCEEEVNLHLTVVEGGGPEASIALAAKVVAGAGAIGRPRPPKIREAAEATPAGGPKASAWEATPVDGPKTKEAAEATPAGGPKASAGGPEVSDAACMALTLWGLAEYIRTTDAGGEFLSQDECHRAVGALRQYQEGYAELAHRAAEAGASLYKMRRKNHMIVHQIWLIEETGLNPKFWACWMDEDLMGKLRTICQATKARGVTVVRASLKRWLWCRLQNNFIMGRAEYVWGQ